EIGCAFPRMANAALEFTPLRTLMEKTIGLSAKRLLPKYASERFDRWFARRSSRPEQGEVEGSRGSYLKASAAGSLDSARDDVILWDDTFVRYNEPHIGIAAVKVLEALGLHVSLVRGRKCCGRPAFSQGNLEAAAAMGQHNLHLLKTTETEVPLLFLEPSCYSMFVE